MMVISVVQQRPRAAVVEVLDFMRKRGLSLDDLIDVSGEDLKSPDPKRKAKARYVERCWGLMTRLRVSYADLRS